MTARTESWRPAGVRDIRVGEFVRVRYSDGSFTFVGKIVRHWRGWDALVVGIEGGQYRISRGFSDWGAYTVEVYRA